MASSGIDFIRSQVPWMKDLSDEDVLRHTAEITGRSLPDAAEYLGYEAPKSMMGKELYAGGNRYLAGFGHIGSAMGIPGAAEYTKAKEARADTLQGLSTAPHSFEEMKFGDSEKGFLPYAGQLAAGSAPYIAEAAGYTLADVATGGALTPAILARYAAPAARLGISVPEYLGGQGLKAGATFAERRAALTAAEESAPGLARTAMIPAVTYPSSLGDTLSNQFEEKGTYNLPQAMAAAVPYSALNVLGVEGAISHGSLPRLGLKGLEKNMAGRAVSGALATGTSEAFNEAGQEVANQYARMGVNPNATLTDPAALERYKESAIGGGILGGLPGSLHAFGGRKALDTKQPADLTKRLPDETYEQALERSMGMAPGGLGIRTPEAHAKFTQEQAERDLTAGLYPGAAPAAPVYSADAVGEMERAANVPPGTFSPVVSAPAAKAPAGGVKAKATENAKRDATAEAVDPVLAQITDTNLQLRDPYIASHLPADHGKTPNQIRHAIRTLVGDAQTPEAAAEVLKTKIVATLAPAQGKGSRAERDARAEKMIQFYDNIVGTPDAERKTLDQWRDDLKAQSAAAALANAAATAKVGQEGQVPGAVTSIDPATLNAAPAPTTPVVADNIAATAPTTPPVTPETASTEVPAKPQSPAELPGYQAAITPHLLAGVAPEELQALQLVQSSAAEPLQQPGTVAGTGLTKATVAEMEKTPEGRRKLAQLAQKAAEAAELPTMEEGEGAGPLSLRHASKVSGIPVMTLQNRVAKALAKIEANAAKPGIDLPLEAARKLLGLDSVLDIEAYDMPTVGYEGGRAVPSYAGAAGDERPDIESMDVSEERVATDEGEEVTAAPEEGGEAEAAAETTAVGDVGGKKRVEFENKWVDSKGQPISHADVQDATQEYEAGRAPDEPTWDRLSPTLQLQWVRGYIGALDTFPKAKQEPERQSRLGAVRMAMLDTEEQAPDEADTRTAGDDAGADRQAEEGADVAARASGSGQAVEGVSGGVQPEPAGGVPPATAGDTKGAGSEAPAVAGETGKVAEAAPAVAVEKKKRTRKAAPTPPTTPEEKQALETSAERAERKWNEAVGHVADLGQWEDQTDDVKAAFTAADEKDQKLADALKLKNAATLSEAEAKRKADEAAVKKAADAVKAEGEAKAAEATPAEAATAEQLQPQVDALPKAEQQALADHYGTKIGSKKFFTKLSADVQKYVNKGAQAVQAAIREIVAKIAAGVMSVGLVFNPAVFDDHRALAYDLPAAITSTATVTTTKEIRAEVPTDARAKMSELAIRVYEAMAPHAIARYGMEAGRAARGFIIADKPAGMLHAFHADGTLMAQSPALYGKDTGDSLKGDSLKGGKKITPAGTFTLVMQRDAETAEYAGGAVFALKETREGGGYIAVHAVYLGEPAEQRQRRLDSESPADNRISYGCINTTNETFLKDLLPNSSELTGGPIFVLPDAVDTTEAMFPAKTETTTTTTTSTSAPGNATAAERREDLPANREQAREQQRVASTRRRGGIDRAAEWAKQKWGERIAPNGKKIVDNFLRWFGDSIAVNSKGEPTLLYHGTLADFNEFRNGWQAKLATALGFHFAVDPKVAHNITLNWGDMDSKTGANVIPVHLKIENPLVITGKGSDDTEVAKAVLRVALTPEYLHQMLNAIGHRYNLAAAKTMMQRWAEGKTNHVGARDFTRDQFIDAHTNAALTSMPGADSKAAINGVVEKFVKESGYDGIVYENTSPMETRGADDRRTYIAFEPTQVKSAIANSGNFDEQAPNIMRSEASLRDESGRGRKTATTATHMRNTLKKLFFSDSRLDQRVTIVQSVSDLDPDLVERMQIGPNDQGFADDDGHVTLIADNIDKGSELGIFLHEMGVHVGMEKLIGTPNMVSLAKKIADWAARTDGSLESVLAKRVMERVENAAKAAEARGEEFTDANYMQEAIAYLVEEAVHHGVNPTAMDASTELGRWFRRLWASAKVALRKMGLNRFDSITAQDVVNLAYGAARLELEGNWHGTAAEFRAFNHKYMGTGEGAQAFGWGTYLAQRPGIAKDYWESEVSRKGLLGMEATYDGKVVEPSETDPVEHAQFAAAMYSAGFYNVDPAISFQHEIDKDTKMLETPGLSNAQFAELNKSIRFYQKVLYAYGKVDPSKLHVRNTQTEGSLMRVDVGIGEHEWLDFDRPFIKQSQHVQDALNKLIPETQPTAGEVVNAYVALAQKLPDRQQAIQIMGVAQEWESNGGKGRIQDAMKAALSAEDFEVYSKMREQVIKRLYTPIPAGMNGRAIYDMLAWQHGYRPDASPEVKTAAKKAASEALDKAGIKGNKFFDAASRNGVTVEYTGPKDAYIPIIKEDMERGLTFAKAKEKRLNEIRREAGYSEAAKKSAQFSLDRVSKAQEKDYKVTDDRTRNFVVYNDKNIHRAVTQVGAKPSKLQFSTRAGALPGTAKATGTKHLTNAQVFAQKHGLGIMITEDIADLAAHHGLPEARAYVNTAKKREASRVEYEQPVTKVTELYDRLPERERGTGEHSVNKFIHDATMRGDINGINRLSASGQDLVKAVFKHGSDTLALKKQLIAEDVGKEYNKRIAEETEDAEKDKLRKERDLLLKKFSKLWTLSDSKTYAPLKRFGDYVVSAKSAEYLKHEAGKTDEDRKWISDNQTDAAHVQVHFADTQGEADALEAEIKRDMNFKGGQTYAAAREADIHNHRDLFRAFPVLQAKLAEEFPVAEGKVSPMARVIRDLYLQALAENTARKNELRRRGITGASHDMMRAFVTQGRADAHFLASLKHNDATQDAVQAMRKGADRDRRTLTPYLNEMLKRHASSYENHSNSVANRFKRVTSMWMLATNPTYYLQQVVQPWMMSLPVIAGKHGYFRTARALQEGYKALGAVLEGTGLTGQIDWTQAPADVRAMLEEVSRNGAIDVTNSVDQGEWQFVDKGRAGAAWNRIDQKLRGLNTRVEAINRASTAIASYRLELARNGGDKAAATEYAEAMVRQTHGSYDASNTPRYMQGPTAQVVTQFRRFQIIQISLIARLAYNAFKGSTPMEKAIARRALTFTLLHTGAMGGALGMPGAALITSIVARLFGPDDEPPDFEKEAREAIGDQTIADLLLKGVPAMLGVDLSSKFGMGQMLSIAPFADFPYDRKSFEKYVFAALGPVVGLGAKAVDGMAQLYAGELAKGAELLLPVGIGNAMKGMRYGTEGISLRKGDTVMSKDEIGFADALLQGLGMPTTTITHQQRLSQTKYEFDTYYKDRTSGLIRDYQQARKDGEPTGTIMQEWSELQDARVRNGYARQPMSTLIKSAAQQRKYERNTAGGVEFTKANRKFVQEQANL